MAKLKSKGTALLQSISAAFVPIAQLNSIDVSGEKSETYDSTTLDGGVGKTLDPTGYVAPATIKAEGFWDLSLSGHIAYQALVRAPVPTNFKVTYTDAGPTSEIYAGTGFGLDKKASPADGLKGSLEIVTSGLPS
jgi:hypothetical protein